MNHKKMRERGFTLLEAIVTLVIVAIMATMIFTYSTSKSFTGSATSAQWVQSANSIHQIMERITADYQGYPRWKPNTGYTTSSRVTPISRNGYFYQPIANCTSGPSDPLWTLPPSATPFSVSVLDSVPAAGTQCTWTAYYSTHASSTYIMSLATQRQKIAGNVANSSGEGNTVYYDGNSATGMQYKIVNNRYIDTATSWDNAVVSSSYLKVTIQAANGNEKLTVIFTE
jgi:prepilin-type N-terminal cleavage/methylation domain-containing protein